MENKTVVFALTSNVGLASEIVGELGMPLGQYDVKHFSDKEVTVELGGSVRRKNVYIIQSTCTPVSSNIMEVLTVVDTYKRASADHISTVIPYFRYARQDHKARPRQPVIFRLVTDLLERTGANRIIITELHATQIQGFFDIPTGDISAICIIGQYFKGLNLKGVMVVSPDHGETTRARRLAEILHAPLATIDRCRPKPNMTEAMNIIGDVNGKVAIMIDDVVDTAGTLAAGIQMLYNESATVVYAPCVRGILSGLAIDRLKAANPGEFVCTNTILQDDKVVLYPQIKILSVGPVLGQVIEAVGESRPVNKIVAKYAE